MTIKPAETVREYLKKRGCPAVIADGGFEGLLDQWESIVDEIVEGYEGTLEDYVNDLDTRQMIEELLPRISNQKLLARLSEADRTFKAAVKPRDKCLWDEDNARQHGWSKEKNWWFFSFPTRTGEDFLRASSG